MNIKQNVRYFFESNFGVVSRLFVLIYPNQNDSVKIFDAKKYYVLKRIIKKYVIIKGKNFYDPPIDFYIKRSKDIKTFRKDQDEDYTTGCL